jgi:hypothetical protein
MTTLKVFTFEDPQEFILDGFPYNELTMEEKLVQAHEQEDEVVPYLDQADIREIVEQAMSALPFGFQEEEVAMLYDVIHDAVIATLDRVKVD